MLGIHLASVEGRAHAQVAKLKPIRAGVGFTLSLGQMSPTTR
jgi:hypothetical protein